MRWILARARARDLLPVMSLFGLTALAMFVWPGLVSRVADRCGGLSPLDVRGYWTAADAADLVSACNSEGRTAYLHLQLLDLVYPAASSAALLLATALLLRLGGSRGRVLLVPALAMPMFDYAENIAVWTLLLRWPEVDPAAATIGGTITAVKRVVATAAFTIPIPLILLAIIRRRREV